MSSHRISDAHSATPHYLMWFRRDLRLHDNTALSQLCEQINQLKQTHNDASPVQLSALFVITPMQWLQHNMSLAQFDLICRTLPILADTLHNQLGMQLQVLVADTFVDSIELIEQLCRTHTITHVFANHEYEVNEQLRDQVLTDKLGTNGIKFERFHDQCILPPQSVTTNDGGMYQVFTPFYNKWQSILDTSPPTLYNPELNTNLNPDHPINMDSDGTLVSSSPTHTFTMTVSNTATSELTSQNSNDNADDITPLKTRCKTAITHYQQLLIESGQSQRNLDVLLAQTRENYPAGEIWACHRLDQFIAEDIHQYDISRDQPALEATSQLSAYLAIGSISPRLCYLQACKALASANQSLSALTPSTISAQKDIQRWINELAWRDFYRHVIVARPDIVRHHAYKIATDIKVPWRYDLEDFAKWCSGITGVPLVDAAMRCLNITGFMHNRLRMVTAMFLTKDLLIDWRWGERYFMQCLIDGDFASNNGGWQWSASVGTDAAPYFRIMNPFSQAKTHDKDAIFIKTWLPELKDIPAAILHDEAKLRKALVKGGSYEHIDYPLPMVDHKAARLRAIEVFKAS